MTTYEHYRAAIHEQYPHEDEHYKALGSDPAAPYWVIPDKFSRIINEHVLGVNQDAVRVGLRLVRYDGMHCWLTLSGIVAFAKTNAQFWVYSPWKNTFVLWRQGRPTNVTSKLLTED